MKPKVSIITPAYNAAVYLPEMIASALAQSYRDWELIIVDDGSTDNTAEAVAASRRGDARIIYIKKENAGIASARNLGIARSQGEYIAFLDADDVALPNRIAEQVDVLEKNTDYGIVYCRFKSFAHGRPGKLYSYKRKFYSGHILKKLLRLSFINPSTVMMRKSSFDQVGGFNSSLREGEDWDLWRKLAYKNTQFFFLDKVLVHTRLHPDSLSGFHNQVKMKKTSLMSFHQMFAQMTAMERQKYNEKKVIGRLRVKLAIAHLLFGHKDSFRFWLKQSRIFYWRGLWLTSLLPTRLTSPLIKTVWQWKQRRLFVD